MNTENPSFIEYEIKSMVDQTHKEMIDSYLNHIESFRITFNDDDFDELINEFFKYYNYIMHDYLEKMEEIKNELRLFNIRKLFSKQNINDNKNQSFIKSIIKLMINETHNKMIDSYLNQIRMFKDEYNNHYYKLIEEFFKSYNYMIYDYLKKISEMNNKFKPIYINKQILKHLSKHNTNETMDYDDIIINI